MNKTTDKAVDKNLRKIINDKALKPEEKRLLMQYMEEIKKGEKPETER